MGGGWRLSAFSSYRRVGRDTLWVRLPTRRRRAPRARQARRLVLPQHQRFLTQREGEPMQALAALFEHADQFQPAAGLIGDAVRLGEEHIQPFAKRTHFRAGAGLGLRLGAHRLEGGGDLAAVLADQRDAFAIALDALVRDRPGDQPVGRLRDWHHVGEAEVIPAELLQAMNLPVGVNPADAGMLPAELLPGEPELLVLAAIANGFQALGVGSRAAVGDQTEGLMAPQPGAQVHQGFFILAVLAILLLTHELLRNRNGVTVLFFLS